MKFYVASSFSNIENVRIVSGVLRNHGFCQTYDWTINNRANSIESLTAIGESEKKGVAESDILVVLLPGGKGSHIEMGIALGLGKTVYLYSSKEEYFVDYSMTSTFYHIEGVKKYVGSIEAFLEFIVTEEGSRPLK